MRMNFPGAESCAVGSGDGNVVEFCIERLSGLAKFANFIFGERASGGVKRTARQVDCADGAQDQVEDDSEEEPAGAARHRHSLMEGTGFGVGWFQGNAILWR